MNECIIYTPVYFGIPIGGVPTLLLLAHPEEIIRCPKFEASFYVCLN